MLTPRRLATLPCRSAEKLTGATTAWRSTKYFGPHDGLPSVSAPTSRPRCAQVVNSKSGAFEQEQPWTL
jgi:hypothetical protein